jgi:hypothetical protein
MRLLLFGLGIYFWMTFAVGFANAADVSCVRVWGSQTVDSSWLPSGRRPTPQTCTNILIQGPLDAGDAQKFIPFLQPFHPLVDGVTHVRGIRRGGTNHWPRL